MLEISIDFWQTLVVIAVCIFVYFVTKKTIAVLLKIIFSNKKVMAWNLKRQIAQKKLIKKTELEQLNENLNILEQFIEWVGKKVPHKQHKQFWKDFSGSKQTRDYWVKTLRDLVNVQIKNLEAPPKQVKNPIKNDNIKK